uniref:SGNH domain-containing protein n=1 Tax=Tetraselmis chuii TaxID=63592 RepID=A0A7S1SVK5_9CHLO|mmetsp:Transcript_317/g.546  ORF Transcript_317/g.546 Transcript_317/m.546 type:complete len:420 (+) Transcript_317:253-1512(+)
MSQSSTSPGQVSVAQSTQFGSAVLPILLLFSFASSSLQQQHSSGQSGAAPLLTPCYNGDADRSREIPALLVASQNCTLEQQGGIPYRLHTRRYPYCRRQCPVQMVPRGCSLSELSPSSLMRLLAGRRLVLWGDSVSRMHFDFLVRVFLHGCVQHRTQFARRARSVALRTGFGSTGGLRGYSMRASANGAGGTVLRKTRACRPLPAEERGAPSCVKISSCTGERSPAAVEICYVHSFREALSPDSEGCLEYLKPTDVVVFNTGLHFQPNERGQYSRSLESLASAWRRVQEEAVEKGRVAPLAIWRETSPQHFDSPGGEFAFRRVAQRGSYSCAAVKRSEALQHNWRNRVADGLLSGMPFLRVWSLSLDQPQLHTQYRVKPGGEVYADCSHFCISERGIYFAWSTLLLNQLTSLLPTPSRQ